MCKVISFYLLILVPVTLLVLLDLSAAIWHWTGPKLGPWGMPHLLDLEMKNGFLFLASKGCLSDAGKPVWNLTLQNSFVLQMFLKCQQV